MHARKYQSRYYVIRTDLDQIRRISDVCRIGRITRYKHFNTDSVMPRLTCWAYIALFCNSVKMAPPVPKHVVVLIAVMSCILLSTFVGECVGCKNVHGMNNNIKTTNKILCNLRFIKNER